MQKLFLVTANSIDYKPGVVYGPFHHWQAIADWLDANAIVRDHYKWAIFNSEPAVNDDLVKKCNAPYDPMKSYKDDKQKALDHATIMFAEVNEFTLNDAWGCTSELNVVKRFCVFDTNDQMQDDCLYCGQPVERK